MNGPNMSSPTLNVSLALTVALLAACGPAQPPSVVLIVADTLRADKLGCYGSERGLTPYIDRFAAESSLFEHTTSHAPWTLPATASLLTSLYPQQHGAGGRLPDFTGLNPAVETLAERFLASGYRTHAVVNVAFLGGTFGLTRGFEQVDEQFYGNNLQVRSASDTTDAALSWIDGGEAEPFFLMVHYFDVHAVYAPPQPFRRRFAAPPDREDERFVFGTRSHMISLRAGKLKLEPEVIGRAERLYDAEVAYMDSQIGRLIDGLAERGLDQKAIVILTADHGEEFLDHGGFEHGHTLYGELTDVPLIMRVRGATVDDPPAARYSASVGHVDVAPTLCDLAGLLPSESYMGRSLVPWLEGDSLPEVALLAHGDFWDAPLSSTRLGNFKLILPEDPQRGAPELYHWRDDPLERDDLASQQADVVRQLTELLADFGRLVAQQGPGARVELSAEMTEQLKGLGYGGDED